MTQTGHPTNVRLSTSFRLRIVAPVPHLSVRTHLANAIPPFAEFPSLLSRWASLRIGFALQSPSLRAGLKQSGHDSERRSNDNIPIWTAPPFAPGGRVT